MENIKLLNKYSYLHSINGSLIEAALDDVSVGKFARSMKTGKLQNV